MSFDSSVFAEVATVVVMSVGAFTAMGIAVHAYLTRSRRSTNRQLPPNDERMARLEQAVDVIAVEVERISEGQRFTTRLLTERSQREIDGVPTATDR